MGQTITTESMAHLGSASSDKDDGNKELARKQSEQFHIDEAQLDDFLAKTLLSVSELRRKRICRVMLGDGLTVTRLVRTAQRPQGLQVLIQSLDLDTTDLRRGERLDITNAAADLAQNQGLTDEPMPERKVVPAHNSTTVRSLM